MSEKTTVGGIPVECLTGECAAVWSGWRTLGDREVVREASAKGTHINLSYKCLATRRNCSLEQAEEYFFKEVQVWVSELLKKQQIFRASHILKNIGQDPADYILNVCTSSKDPRLRAYLAEYIKNRDGFTNTQVEAFHILQAIAKHEEKYKVQDNLGSTMSIEDVINLPRNVKQGLCTELYFSVNNPDLLSNTCDITLWDYLLSNNKINLIRLWIDIQYKSDKSTDCDKTDEQLESLFAEMQITPIMLESIDSSNASPLVKHLVKNHLCRYGIFMGEERHNIKLTLARIFGSALTLTEFEHILSYESCNIERSDFLENVNRKYYLTYFHEESCIDEPDVKSVELLKVISEMCKNPKSYDALTNAIFYTVHYLSDNVDEFLKRNYPLVLAVAFLKFHQIKSHPMMFNKNESCKMENFSDIFKNERGLQTGTYIISHEVLQSALKQVPILHCIVENKMEEDKVTMYDLLDGYKNLNVKQLFKWRFNNERMPHFSDENLVRKYGYKETLTYAYYLKGARPNMAIYHLKHVKGKLCGNLSSQRKFTLAFRAHVFALRNNNKSDIVCGCISFIEMLGIDSEKLRLHITAARYVQKELNISIEDLLEGVICGNQNDLKTILSYLEDSFQMSLEQDNLISEGRHFVKHLKTWDVIIQLARVHNSPLPDILLKYLAKRNLWFEFVLVGQMIAYSKDQILENVKFFTSSTIQEHLMVCLTNPELEKLNLSFHDDQKLRTRDTRQSLYNKIGLKQSISQGSSGCGSSSSSSVDSHSIDSYHSLSNSTSTNLSSWPLADDLWLTILKCHQSQDPPRALVYASRTSLRPILTIIATCYEPSSTRAYCYSWMTISTADEDIISDYVEYLEHQIWPASKVLELKQTLVSRGYMKTLSRAYKIFMPESSFTPLFEFLMKCVNYGEFEDCQNDLKDFKHRCSSLKCNKIINWDDTDMTYSENLYWIATVALRCIITALGHSFQSAPLKIKFLKTLIKCNFLEDLPVPTLNFQSLVDILRILINTDLKLDFNAFNLSNDTYDITLEIQRCISDLVSAENYCGALQLSKIVGLDPSEIILAKYQNEFKQYMNVDKKVETSFWKQCALDFKNHGVSSSKAAEFFVEHAEKVLSDKERYEILKLTFETLKNIETDQRTMDTIEMAKWKSCLLAGPENIDLESDDRLFNKLKTELLSGLNNLSITCTLTDTNEKNAAESLISKLIDSGKLHVALKVSAMFNYNHKDLQILLLCLSLAEGEILPTELSSQQRALLSESHKTKLQKYGTFRNRGLRRLSSSSSLNISTSSTQSPGEISIASDVNSSTTHQIQIECLSLLEKLYESLQHGTNICVRIITCYKLALHVGRSYQCLLVLNDPIQFLNEVMESNISNKFDVATDIISAYKIENLSVATFLAQNITLNITRAIEDGYEDMISMWGYSLNTKFHLIMELCSDVSILGTQLLETAQKLLDRTHGEKRQVSVLKTVVELLIRSHDCFTASCNMEGIAAVLRKCQHLANTLKHLKHWTLLVRLVTGVGRFTEMHYVFHILKENDHFEFLLGKGLDKVPGLKMALLEFLKRHCPEDKDLFTLVALHFRLYHEIALMWENEAKDVIAKIISEASKDVGRSQTMPQPDTKLTKNETVQKLLHLAIDNYTHATEYYLQDNKLNLASRCCHQAQLVAVQISLLAAISNNQQVVCVLNMKADDIDKMLCHMLNIPQSLILVQAYNHHADWANVIYNRCILNGETKYLKDFITVNKLTPALVQDCARRYRSEKDITHSMTDNMRLLISELKDVECKYVLSSQLGFKTIVESMLNDPLIGAYLKDTVWKKGYNAL